MMWGLYDRLKQIFCLHKWKHVSTRVYEHDGHYVAIKAKYQCEKCGKVKCV